jgi:hypothetical protein
MTPQNVMHQASLIEVADVDLVFRAISVSDKTPTGSQILAYADSTPRDEFIVLQWLASGDVEEVRPDEVVHIATTPPSRFIVSKADRLFRLMLDDRSIVWPRKKINEASLRRLGQIDPHAELLLKRDKGPDQKIEPGQDVSLADTGVEIIRSKGSWKLNVQGVVIQSAEPTITVRNALIDAGFEQGQEWIIVLKTSEGRHPVGLDYVIDLRLPGIEKLRLTPRDVNNGDVAELARDFRLLPADEKGLRNRGLTWETVNDGGHRWLLMRDYPLPPGFNHASVTMALDIPSTYPAAEIDMFYCLPHVEKRSGQPIPQTEARASIRGAPYQRWSRHRGPSGPWRPNVDNVLSHLALVDSALLREVEA